ncbi:amiloride-sensitive sodium channel subunit alpha-like [Mercenaria mercenaria]|uniref:amiloride-sensitive sodium channel subunit alpha-like n=1 Tax=Mercenaria mercenaria TaxID=6596 RepID=UPI00234F60BE|nr:amiloride-sensitive sodium channel subunit alpha-like [Mercenaria mercenaria]
MSSDKTRMKGRVTKTTPTKDKEVKKVCVKPLMPEQRLNSNNNDDVALDTISGSSPKEKTQLTGSIHDILGKMKVPPDCQDSKAGKLAADRWRQRSAKQVYDDFCSETSFTALTRIHKASHWYKRILWTFACLSMLVWLIIQITWLFQKYLSYPVEVKIEVEAVPNLIFPSVTICNLNPLKRSMMGRGPFKDISYYFKLDDSDILYDDFIKERRRKWLEENETFHDDEEHLRNYMKNNSFNRWNILENDTDIAKEFYSELDDSFIASFAYSSVAATMRTRRFRRFGHQKRDLILSCSWQGMSCSPANFTYHRSQFYGNCYTINTFDNGKAALSTNYAGPLMGLALELNIEQDEYIAALSADAGVRITIHPRGIYPFPEDEGISIPPGFKTSIGIAKTELTRLTPPHADCGNSGPDVTNLYSRDFGTSYSKQTCLKSCVQQQLLDICGCVSSYFYVPENVSICSFTGGGNESICVKDTICAQVDECNRRCPTPCQETKYEFTSSMSKWPSEKYADHLDTRISKSMSRFMDKNGSADSEHTLAKVVIYFRELVYEKIEQQKAYESQNLISDIGGQLGLWLGLSAITVGELIEFFASLGKLICANVCKKKTKPDKVGLRRPSLDIP